MHHFKDFCNNNDKVNSLRNNDSLEESEAIRKREEEIKEEYRLSLRELELNRQKNQDSYVEALQNIFTSSKIVKPISKSQLLQHHTQPYSESIEQLKLTNIPNNSLEYSLPQSVYHSVDHSPSTQQWQSGHFLDEMEASKKQHEYYQQDAADNNQTKISSQIQEQSVFQASSQLSPQLHLSNQQPPMNSVYQQSQQLTFQVPIQSPLSSMQSSGRPQLQIPARYSAPALNGPPVQSSSQKAYQPPLQIQQSRHLSSAHTEQLLEPVSQQSYQSQSQSDQSYMRLPQTFSEPLSSQPAEQQLQSPYPHSMQPPYCQSLQLPLQSLSPTKSAISSTPPQCGDSHVLQSQNYYSKHSVKQPNDLLPSTCNSTSPLHFDMSDNTKSTANSVCNTEFKQEASVDKRNGGTSNNSHFNYFQEVPIKVTPADDRYHSNYQHGRDQATVNNFSNCQQTEQSNYYGCDAAQQPQLQNLSLSFLHSDQQATQPTNRASQQSQNPLTQKVISPPQLPHQPLSINRLETMQQQQLPANMPDKYATKQTYNRTNSDASHTALQKARIAVLQTDTSKAAANNENSIDLHPHQMRPVSQLKSSPTLPEPLPPHEACQNYSMAKQQALRRQYDSSQAEKALRQVYEREMEAELRAAQGEVPQEQVSILQPWMNLRFVCIVALQ